MEQLKAESKGKTSQINKANGELQKKTQELLTISLSPFSGNSKQLDLSSSLQDTQRIKELEDQLTR